MPHVVFIHGIENKPAPDALLALWRDALAAEQGVDLAQAGCTSQMVYWADVLYDEPLTEAVIEESVAAASEIDTSGAVADLSQSVTRSSEEAAFIAGLAGKFTAVAMQAAAAEAVNAPAIGRIEERVPLPWSIKEPLMAKFLRDVHHYLFNVEFSPRPGKTYRVRDEIRSRFVTALADRAQTSPPYIVVSHSMGTVIAYDCLKRVTNCPEIDALMTIGSPLGLDEIQDELKPGWTRQDGFPGQKLRGGWTNVFDPLDPVAGFDPRLANDFEHNGDAVVRDIVERNYGLWRHSIDKYLRGPQLRAALQSMLGLPVTEARVVGRVASTSEWSVERPVASKPARVSAKKTPSVESNDPFALRSGRQLLTELTEAVTILQHEKVADICVQIVSALCLGNVLFDTNQAKDLLALLRKKRYFKQMIQIGDALIQAGIDAPLVRRQYAQGLIDSTQGLTDTGHMTAALCILQGIAAGGQDPKEVAEARGLIGRVHKQLYVNAANEHAPNIDELQLALRAYYDVYRTNPKKYAWHGINVVALLARAERDGVPQSGYPGYQELARQILADFSHTEEQDLWSLATAAEAYLALNNYERTIELLKNYVAKNEVDAFELNSSLRQFKEVWQLSSENEQQAVILALLQSQLMKREGSRMELNAADMAMKPLLKLEREGKLEKVFGDESYKTLKWYRLGLSRCSSVARFETKMGRGMGTGFVVNGDDIHPKLAGKFLILTNAHIVSETTAVQPALRPDEAVVTFECWPECEKQYEIESVIWSSPPGELDATLVELKPALTKCVGNSKWVPVNAQKKHVYLIGHPLGGSLSLSLHDNMFLAYRDPKLHYRTPSEPGSSGSPVFDDNWDFIGLHHAGDFKMAPLDGGTDPIEANEGMSLLAIREAVAAFLDGKPAPSRESSASRQQRVVVRSEVPPAVPSKQGKTTRSTPTAPTARGAPVITYPAIVAMLSGEGARPREESAASTFAPATALKLVEAAAAEVVPDARKRAALLAEFTHALSELEQESNDTGAQVLSSPRNRMASILQSVLAEQPKVSESIRLEFAFDKDDTEEALKEVFRRAKHQEIHEQLHPTDATPDALPDHAKIFLVSDFGTGLYGAPQITSTIAKSGSQFDLMMHLGDIYYSGTQEEVQNRFLSLWPKEAGAVSRNLNGNHDMYSGGFGYFDKSLPAFEQNASYFAMQNKRWLLVGLDTSYKDNNLGKKQVAWFKEVMQQAGNRKLILFSHHPLFSNFKDQGIDLADKLHDVLHARRITAWYWGHEHHCAIYKRHPIYRFFGRCMGHGGMPYRRKKVAQYSVDEEFAADHNPGDIEWRKCVGPLTPTAHYLDGPNKYIDEEPDKYGPHGYMTLELTDSTIIESVCDPSGKVIYQREIR
jgi:pimeloyl-ACP methyl ester carboxylesterase